MRILVVDDSETVRLAFADHIAALAPSARVTLEPSPGEGLDRVASGEFDLVFLDGAFADGTPSVEVLRSMLAATPRARVVLTTARPREHPEVVEALGLGAYAYLAKPLRRGAIEEILQRVQADAGNVGRIR